jgi:phosphate acetyltransferase/phosphate butyryltransferase
LIAPNIETANGIYKAMVLMVKAKTAGIIFGGKVPIAISSRCDTVESMHNSLAFGSLVALSRKP